MKKIVLLGKFLFVSSLLLGSCKLPAPATPEPTEPDAQAVFTAAAQTAEAKLLERAETTSSPTPEEPVATVTSPATTATAVIPTLALTLTATTPLTTIAPPTDAPAAGGDKAAFEVDITIPDGTVVGPEKKFVKTWRLKNVGKTTWTTAYSLIFIDGNLMGASSSIPMPKSVAPWEKVSISVNMIAPSAPGKYRSYWKLKNAENQIFGVGPNGDEAIWVEIVVKS